MDKNRDTRHSLFILFCIFCFIAGTIYVVILSRALADYKFMAGDRIKFNSLYVSFQSLLSYKKQQNIFYVFESILSLIVFLYIYFVVARPKKFESDVVKITPTISIPSPAGQGQFGSKWFLENIHETTYKKQKFSDWWFKRKRKEVFARNNINFSNPFIKNLINTGDEDIKDKINKLNNGVSIAEIEKEIKDAREKKAELEQKENSEKEWITQFSNNDEFASFESFNDTEFEENFDLLEATNNTLDINEFENDIETANDLLVKKYADEIARKNEEDLKKEKPYNPKEDKNKIFKSGGLIVGIYSNRKNGFFNAIKRFLKRFFIIGIFCAFLSAYTPINENSEDVYFVDKDTHSVIIGATRSGKSRCVVLQSIINTALAGESIVVTDPKGELYAYTSEFMKKLGYEVICIDFKNAKKSDKYNLLQPILNAAKDKTPEHPNGDIELIVKYSEELSNLMFKETKDENPMWIGNAKSLVTGAILSLILENDDKTIQNISNVYRFIMNGEGKDICPDVDNLYLFVKALQIIKPESPIIDTLLQIVNSPKETRGGFTANAGFATRLFTQPSIWEITHTSNIDLTKMGERKQILYFVLPDQDTSYYKIVSIIVKQMYNELTKICDDKYGGRLPIRVNFFLDEFGNFAPFPDLESMLTVSGGRGMRFNLFLQGFPQVTKKYDKETTEIVKSNCETWVYLKANDTTTLDEISKKLGSYTIYSNSESMNLQGTNVTSHSSSQSLQKRSLLLPEEVNSIERPYLLVMNGSNAPAVNEAPDISQLSFNKMLGMGGEHYNNQLRMIRDRQRPILKTDEEAKYWTIFEDLRDYCNDVIDKTEPNTGKPRNVGDAEYITNIAQYLLDSQELKVA